MWKEIVLLLFLLIGSWSDLKERRISGRLIAAAFAVLFPGFCLDTAFIWTDLVLVVSPGAFCLLLSLLTREQIGYGDGLSIILCGLALGYEKGIQVDILAFLIAALLGILILLLRLLRTSFPLLFRDWKHRGLFRLLNMIAGQKQGIPFLPCLLAADLIIYLEPAQAVSRL